MAVLLVAGVLRFPLLFSGLYTDEGGTYLDIANPTLAAVLHHVAVTEFNPPGYFLIAWLWTHVAGLSELMLKLPSFLFGLGLVAAVYRLGRLIDSRATACLAAALMALSITATILSAAARPYSLAGLLSTIVFIAFIEIFYSRAPAFWALTFWFFAAALAFVHYSGLILLLALFFGAAIIAWRESLWRRFAMIVLASAAVIVVYLTQVPHLLHESTPSQVRSWLEASQAGGFGSRFLEQLGFVVPFVVMRLQITAVCLLAILASLVAAMRWNPCRLAPGQPTLVAALTVCLLIATLIETLMFMREQRYMFVFAPLGSVLLAVAIRWSWNFLKLRSQPGIARIGLALVLLWLVVGVVSGQASQYVRLYRNPSLSGLRDATLNALDLDRDGRTLFVLVPDASAGVFRYYARNSGNVQIIGFPYRRSAPTAVTVALAPIKGDNWKLVQAQITSLVPARFYRIAIVEAPRSLASHSQALQAAVLLNKLSHAYRRTFDHEYEGYQEPVTLEVFQGRPCSTAGDR